MTLRQVSSAIVVFAIVWSASVASAQTLIANRADETPTFRLLILGRLDPEFTQRISSYHELRVHLEERLPPQVVTDNLPLISQIHEEYQTGVSCGDVGDGDGDAEGGGTSGGDSSTGPAQDMPSTGGCACSSSDGTPLGLGLGLLMLGLLCPWRPARGSCRRAPYGNRG